MGTRGSWRKPHHPSAERTSPEASGAARVLVLVRTRSFPGLLPPRPAAAHSRGSSWLHCPYQHLGDLLGGAVPAACPCGARAPSRACSGDAGTATGRYVPPSPACRHLKQRRSSLCKVSASPPLLPAWLIPRCRSPAPPPQLHVLFPQAALLQGHGTARHGPAPPPGSFLHTQELASVCPQHPRPLCS